MSHVSWISDLIHFRITGFIPFSSFRRSVPRILTLSCLRVNVVSMDRHQQHPNPRTIRRQGGVGLSVYKSSSTFTLEILGTTGSNDLDVHVFRRELEMHYNDFANPVESTFIAPLRYTYSFIAA